MQSASRHNINFVYEDNTLRYILTPEGRALPDGNGGFEYQYFLKDHLGNTRVTFAQTGTVLQEDSYYPFGMAQSGFAYQSGTSYKNKYLYNGKELQDDFGLGWYDYGARFYDAELGRWHSIDPHAENYLNWTPYNYVANNPMLLVDPNGMYIDNYGIDKNGNIELLEKTDDNYDVLYSVDDEGNKIDINGDKTVSETDGAKVNDKSILPSLSKNEKYDESRQMSSATAGEGSVNDMFNVFKFAADNSNVEWGLARYNNNGTDKYWVGTLHDDSNSANPKKAGLTDVIAHMHSHPDILLKNERVSMGDKGKTYYPISDLGHKIQGKRPYLMYVYFPNSKNLYNVSKSGTKYIRNIGNNYKRFYFGTLNHK